MPLLAVALALLAALTLAVPPAAAPELPRRPMVIDISDCRIPEVPRPEPDLRDVQLLARVIWTEARGEPFIGKVAVGAVVMNRVEDDRYPDTVTAVIEAPGQFAVSRGTRPGPECYEAARAAMAGEDPTGGALYFWSRDDGWIGTRPVTARIGGHTFAR